MKAPFLRLNVAMRRGSKRGAMPLRSSAAQEKEKETMSAACSWYVAISLCCQLSEMEHARWGTLQYVSKPIHFLVILYSLRTFQMGALQVSRLPQGRKQVRVYTSRWGKYSRTLT